MERITSRQNPVVKEFKALADSRGIRAGSDGCRRMLLDGDHLVEEALEAGITFEMVAIREELASGTLSGMARRLADNGARVLAVTSAVLDAVSPVREPSGVVAIACGAGATIDTAFGNPPQLVLMLSKIQDPGNVGGVIRAADACGATGIVVSEGTADPFGWKALRGSMGSTFHLPIATGQSLAGAAALARRRHIRLYAAVPRGGTPLNRCNLRLPSAILLGGEGAGLPRDLADLADEHLTIPMRRAVESLNVATAAALITYEALRQREVDSP